MILRVGSDGARAVGGRFAGPGVGGAVLRTGLFERLGASPRVTVVSAPPGSGKTVLLRSWISQAAPADRVAWVPVRREERDPQRFWQSVFGALRRTAHAALIADILSLLAGRAPALPAGPRPPLEPLSDREVRVLRYLPTNLTAPEIAGELSISRNTVKTHIRNLYAKLGTHRRAEAVARARDLGLLAPAARTRR
jgi:ATP/maltotriose-dependent transcriptional regulator MalT